MIQTKGCNVTERGSLGTEAKSWFTGTSCLIVCMLCWRDRERSCKFSELFIENSGRFVLQFYHTSLCIRNSEHFLLKHDKGSFVNFLNYFFLFGYV